MSRSEVNAISRSVDGRVRIAASVIVDRLGVDAGDGFLVVYNPGLGVLADALMEAAARRVRKFGYVGFCRRIA